MRNFSRIHPYKREYVIKIADNKYLQENCKAIYIFGSCVNGCSKVEHRKDSDIDIAIEPINESLLSPINNNIHHVLSHFLIKENNINFDLIWIDKNVKQQNIYEEILKGEQII